MGDKIRFGARWSDRRSGTFVVATSRGTPDIYVMSRAVGRQHRISLHQSGSWRLSVEPIDPATGRLSPPIHGETWSRPPPYAPGLTKIFAVVLPRAGVCLPITDHDDDTRLVPVSDDVWGMQFSLNLSEPHVRVRSWPGADSMRTTLVGEIELASPETLWVVAHEITDRPEQDGEPMTGQLLPGHDMGELESGLDEGTLRGMGLGKDPDGMRWVLESAVVRKGDSVAVRM